MNMSISGNQKKRGRPRSGVRSHIAARVTEEETRLIDKWAEAQSITRAEAIRRLIQRGLEAAQGESG